MWHNNKKFEPRTNKFLIQDINLMKTISNSFSVFLVPSFFIFCCFCFFQCFLYYYFFNAWTHRNLFIFSLFLSFRICYGKKKLTVKIAHLIYYINLLPLLNFFSFRMSLIFFFIGEWEFGACACFVCSDCFVFLLI